MNEINVELGAGMRTPEGFIGIDIRPYKGISHVLDIGSEKFPFDNDSVDYFQSEQLFEHFDANQLFHCMNECFRTIKPTGLLEISVPLWGTDKWLMHPEHKMHWTPHMISFFLPPANGIDPHGYLEGFWHASWTEHDNLLDIKFYPNKEGNPHYAYKEWKRYEDIKVGGEQNG